MELKADPNLLALYQDAEFAVRAAKAAVEDDALKSSPFKKGDIIRNKDTGALYRIEQASAWLDFSGRPRLSLRSTRVYKTGRRDARSDTIIGAVNDYVVDTPAPAV